MLMNKTKTTIGFVLLTMCALMVPALAQGASLISLFEFEGADDFSDSVGPNGATKYTYTGSISGVTNDATTGAVSGRNALILDGVGDGLVTPSNASLDFGQGDSFTYAFWAKVVENGESDNNNYRSTFLMRDLQASPWNGISMIAFSPSSTLPYEVRGALDGGTPSELVRYNASNVTSPIDIFDDTWRHLAFVVDGIDSATGTAALYIDGSLAYSISDLSSLDNGTSIGSFPLFIGTERSNGSRWLKGSLDDLAVWDAALPASSIAGLADGTYSPTTAPIPEPGSIALLLMGVFGLLSLRKR